MRGHDQRGDPFERAVRTLAPYVGDNMARAVLEVSRRKLGLSHSELKPAEVESLIEQMKPGLRVFLGAEQTQRILDQVRTALASKETNR
jgi:hypothetical protein